MMSVLIGVCATYSSNDQHSIELPVKSKHSLKVIKTPSEESDHQTHVDVPGGILPVYLTFKTQSSPIYVKQQHQGAKGSVHKSNSKDEAHQLYHEVIRPVYQVFKEVIVPVRKVVQIVEAVQEDRLTKVHKGESKKSYGDSGVDKKYGDSSLDKKNLMVVEDKIKYGDKESKYAKVVGDDNKYKDDRQMASAMYYKD